MSEPTPQRIVSLVPSLTELVCELGLRDRLVGCTKFCVHPVDLRASIQVVGGTKQVHYDRIDSLRPDLLIANREENTREMVERLQQRYPLLVSDIKTLDDADAFTRQLGSLFRCEARAQAIISANRAALPAPQTLLPRPALYLIWREPWMTVGGDTYIHDIMRRFGYRNVCGDRLRYPTLDPADIIGLEPEIVLLSSEPFPFKAKHKDELQLMLPKADIQLVDGEKYAWYGARLAKI